MSGNVLNTIGRTAYQLGFEICPILLSGGVASGLPGGYLPIVTILQALSFAEGLLSPGTSDSLDSFFAHFKPLPGSTLISNQIGKYPFANQVIAGNAVIAQPLNISLLMICPVQQPGGYLAKLATMTALQALLALHSSQGGVYVVATPSYIWNNAILLDLKDVSSGSSKQPQIEWQWDFEQPLITQAGAANALNSLMAKISGGQVTDGSLSGPSTVAGVTQSGASSTIPAASGLPASLLSSPLTGSAGSTVAPVTATPL